MPTFFTINQWVNEQLALNSASIKVKKGESRTDKNQGHHSQCVTRDIKLAS